MKGYKGAALVTIEQSEMFRLPPPTEGESGLPVYIWLRIMCMYVCMYVCMCAFNTLSLCMYASVVDLKWVLVCMCLYYLFLVCMYVCMYV